MPVDTPGGAAIVGPSALQAMAHDTAISAMNIFVQPNMSDLCMLELLALSGRIGASRLRFDDAYCRCLALNFNKLPGLARQFSLTYLLAHALTGQ